jgi:hypothetical protein
VLPVQLVTAGAHIDQVTAKLFAEDPRRMMSPSSPLTRACGRGCSRRRTENPESILHSAHPLRRVPKYGGTKPDGPQGKAQNAGGVCQMRSM